MSKRWRGLSGFSRLVLLCLLAAPATAEPPQEPRETGSLLLAGRLPWGASALPSGEVLAPCEDQSLTVVDGGAVVARWRSPSRFSAPVSVAPRGPLQLLAVPQLSGRVDVLAWDSTTRVLAAQFATHHAGAVVATAWGATGALFVAWKDGHVEAWSSRGESEWSTDVGFALQALLFDDSVGLYVVGSAAVLLDGRGREVQRWPLAGLAKGVLQTLAGELFLWSDTTLWKKALDADTLSLVTESTQIVGVVSDRLDHLVLTEPNRLRRLRADGSALSAITLGNPAVTNSVLDDRGRIVVGTSAGVEVWTYDGRRLGLLDATTPASPLVLTDKGVASWSDQNWKLHLWDGFQKPPFGWAQEGGGPGRAYSARRPSSVAARATNWTDDPDFGYFYQLVATGEETKQREVLERLEAKSAQGNLLQTWPFANLILLKVARSGLTDLMVDRNRIVNNWPDLRLRAFALLAKTAGPEDREELIALLHREFDPSVAAQGTQALAQSGWDGDGKLMQMLSELQNRMANQAVVADAVIDAARTLWEANGQSSGPELIPLISRLYQGPYPRSVKLKAQKFFQDLMEAP